MLPSVIFDAQCTGNQSNSSAIIHPPIQAYAISLMYNATASRCVARGHAARSSHTEPNTCDELVQMTEFVHEIYPKLTSWHSYLRRERDMRTVGGKEAGLLFIKHPWESTMEDSPLFDMPLLALGLMDKDQATDPTDKQRLSASCFLTNETAAAYWRPSEHFERALRLLKRIERIGARPHYPPLSRQPTLSPLSALTSPTPSYRQDSDQSKSGSADFRVLDVLMNSVYRYTPATLIHSYNPHTLIQPSYTHTTLIHSYNPHTLIQPSYTHATLIHSYHPHTPIQPSYTHTTLIHNTLIH
jgi:hypothetical protein